jgi:predicted ATPase/transcriptional regulator with XRE-family HTH domain
VLKRLRMSVGMTHEALAERAGIGARTISDLERGVSHTPRADTLALLIEALGLPPEERTALETSARPLPRPDPARVRTNLPVQLTSFVDREHESHSIGVLLRRDDSRLITLTGPGGVGKTRLALHIADQAREAFPDGVLAISLAAVTDGDGMVQAISRALDVDAAFSPSPPSLAARLGEQAILLVLDNCEHLAIAGSIVVDLLQGTSQLHVLATSRAPLHVSGEREFPVAPLEAPDPAQPSPVKTLASNPAVALFVDRATLVRPDFVLTDENAAAVAAICTRLEGLPLAVELAAARIKALPPRIIRERLSDAATGGSLRLLTGGGLDRPERQQSLQATIAWSHDLLSPTDQALFRRLAVFAGGCTLESAEVICAQADEGRSSDPVPALDVLDGLVSLVDQSLLIQATGPDGEPRFVMLETIREYAWERLTAAGEAVELRERHARHYLALVETTGALLFAKAPTRVRLAAEDGNVQVALRWLVQEG